ncbi:predicted protein [Histoplasma mississippiense (nom. inval.)]|uniref:predicted protein n=1 Tax=Ajellomyces capsulatus (strain NAm1 / WU24) TaxID=2059318 RepID=UPI000157BFFA|nr:predicted protein [Histoplasma mississippiense (nom. inval.)]EDN06607.1 predicted protein [Histoplasma mississippiense (nom. inval.)]
MAAATVKTNDQEYARLPGVPDSVESTKASAIYMASLSVLSSCKGITTYLYRPWTTPSKICWSEDGISPCIEKAPFEAHREWPPDSYKPQDITPRRIISKWTTLAAFSCKMYPNISYALLSAALIVLSMVHLILLTAHRPQPHRLPEISIFVLFICVNAVVIGIGLSGLRCGDTPAFYYPLGICTAFPLALEMIRQTKIQAGPLTNALLHRLFLGYGFLSPAVKLGLILWFSSVVYEASVKGTAVVVSIDYTVLAIAGLLFWRGIRGIPSQGPVIREVTIHALLVLVTAGFAAGGLVHEWPFWIEVMLIITLVEYAVTLGTAASKVILVLRAMRENAEPNKKTDRSQDRDDGQTTAHVPQTEIGRKRRTEVRQRLRLYCCTWVNRAIKCCNCEVTGSAVNKCACEHEFCLVEMEPNSLGARQSTTCSTHQRRYRDRNFTGCLTCKARHVKCDEAAPACRNCIKRGLHCDGAQNEILFKFFDPSQASSGFVKRQHKAFRRETAKNHGVSSSHPLPYKDPTSPCLRSVDLQSGTHASTESLAMDNPTTGDGKPPFQSTPNDEARDLQSHSSSYNPYSIDEANCYSDYSDIRGDICRGDENVPLAFIVFISEPVLQERLEYLKAHTSELHKQRSVFRTFSELRVDGPLALPYALCLVKTLRQHAGQQLLMNRLNDTILFLSTRLRGLLSTHLLYTHRDRISRASLLLQRPVFYKRSDLPGNIWQESTVLDFSLDGLTVTLHLSNYRVLKVSDELWKGFNSLASGIADPAVMFGVG